MYSSLKNAEFLCGPQLTEQLRVPCRRRTVKAVKQFFQESYDQIINGAWPSCSCWPKAAKQFRVREGSVKPTQDGDPIGD